VPLCNHRSHQDIIQSEHCQHFCKEIQTTVECSVKIRKTYHHPDLRTALITEGLSQLESVGTDLSLRALAKSIGVSPTAPYRHFANRSELMAALAAEGFHRFTTALMMASNEPEPLVALKRLGLVYLKFAQNQPSLYRLMFSPYGYSLNSIECKAAADSAFGTLVGAVARANESGWKPGQTVLTLALAYWAVLHGWAGISGDRLMPPGVSDVSWEDLIEVYLS
jgi:AcrR family transcriptional regulator